MTRIPMWQELQSALKEFLTQASICEDKAEMQFWIDAFTKELAEKYSEEQLIRRLGTVDDVLEMFREFLRKHR